MRLAVYDLLGREVAVLVSERKAPGELHYAIRCRRSNEWGVFVPTNDGPICDDAEVSGSKVGVEK